MDLPPNWELRECKDFPGRIYYYNSVTSESTWIRPIPYPGTYHTKEWPPMVYVLHILIKHVGSEHANPSTVRSREDAKKAVDDVYNQLLKGKDSFENTARRFSDCESKDNGGVLGWIKRGKVPPEFEKAAWGLNIGQISAPFETVEGFHIVLRRG